MGPSGTWEKNRENKDRKYDAPTGLVSTHSVRSTNANPNDRD